VSTDIRDLYQQVIVDHSKRPRNFRPLEGANRKVEGFNPLCGDKITIYLKIENGMVADISFEGSAAPSPRLASLLTESLKGKSLANAEAVFEDFHRLLTGLDPAGEGPKLGKLAVFSGVCDTRPGLSAPPCPGTPCMPL